MLLKTSNGREIQAELAYAPTLDNKMVLRVKDNGQTYGEICEALEGVERFEVQETENKINVYIGYTRMKRISRENGLITIALEQPEVK